MTRNFYKEEQDEKTIQRLIDILDEIEKLEDSFDDENQTKAHKIQKLYEEFGDILFKVQEHEREDCDGSKFKIKTNGVQLLWD